MTEPVMEAPPPMGISVVINTLNEEANIGECIDSVRGLADEIVVCDMHSDDRTVEIAMGRGARIALHERSGHVEPARRYAIFQARCEWVLVLDADERMTESLAGRLKEVVREDTHDVVAFWNLYWYFGDWVRNGGFFAGQWRRFFRKRVYLETYVESEEWIHRNFEALGRARRVLQLSDQYYIRHHAYPTIEKYVSKTLGHYARIEGEEYARLGRRFSLVRMIWEPLKEFVGCLVLRGGYRDGVRGLVLACLYAAYRFCVWANVWFAQSASRSGDRVRRP